MLGSAWECHEFKVKHHLFFSTSASSLSPLKLPELCPATPAFETMHAIWISAKGTNLEYCTCSQDRCWMCSHLCQWNLSTSRSMVSWMQMPSCNETLMSSCEQTYRIIERLSRLCTSAGTKADLVNLLLPLPVAKVLHYRVRFKRAGVKGDSCGQKCSC